MMYLFNKLVVFLIFTSLVVTGVYTPNCSFGFRSNKCCCCDEEGVNHHGKSCKDDIDQALSCGCIVNTEKRESVITQEIVKLPEVKHLPFLVSYLALILELREEFFIKDFFEETSVQPWFSSHLFNSILCIWRN